MVLMNSKKPDEEINELLDIEFPTPSSIKADIYYWLIKYEIRTLKDSIEKLVLENPDKEKLLHLVKSQLVYGLKLKEEAETYRLRLNEAVGAVQIDDNCYIASCCARYIDLLLNDLIDYYTYVLPDEVLKHFYLKLNGKKIKTIGKIERKLKVSKTKKEKNSTPLFTFNAPKEKQDELIMRLTIFLRSGTG